VMTEKLRRPTPELTRALGELMYALGDAGAAVARHTGAAVHSQRCGHCARLEIWELLWRPHTGAVAHDMMELLCSLNADNGQIFLWTGLGIGLVSRGSFW